MKIIKVDLANSIIRHNKNTLKNLKTKIELPNIQLQLRHLSQPIQRIDVVLITMPDEGTDKEINDFLISSPALILCRCWKRVNEKCACIFTKQGEK